MTEILFGKGVKSNKQTKQSECDLDATVVHLILKTLKRHKKKVSN
jgi:hypothetical protein